MLPTIHAVYDRGALIALPADLRESYAKHLSELMKENSQLLLIVLDSSDIVHGAPYPVSATEIEYLYADFCQISELVRFKEIDISAHLREKGYKE